MRRGAIVSDATYWVWWSAVRKIFVSWSDFGHRAEVGPVRLSILERVPGPIPERIRFALECARRSGSVQKLGVFKCHECEPTFERSFVTQASQDARLVCSTVRATECGLTRTRSADSDYWGHLDYWNYSDYWDCTDCWKWMET